MITRPRVVSVALVPSRTVPVLITQAKTIVEKMTGNPSFPSPTPTLAVVTADIVALESAAMLASTRAKGAVQDRTAKERILVTDLGYLGAYVEAVARAADPSNAEAIVTGGGFSVKKINPHPKQDFVVKLGTVSGTVKVIARAAARRASYDWQYSQDDKVWTSAPSTLKASTSIVGLVPVTTYYFRGRSVTKAGVSDWGQVVTIIVL